MDIKQRINYMDILKGLAIIAVVMGHCGAIGSQIIYLFHIPLFFFISGYFYKEIYSNSSFDLFGKRIKTLYLPFIKYEIIFLLIHNIFYRIGFYNLNANVAVKAYTISDIIKNIIHILMFDGTELLLSPFWFISALFIVTMIFCLISCIVNKFKYKKYIQGLIILILFLLGNYLTKTSINIKGSQFGQEIFNVSFVALSFFYTGFLYKKIELKIPMNIIIAITAYIVLYVSSKNNLVIDMRVNYYPNIFMLLVNSILGIYLMIYISKQLEKMKFEFKLLKYIGRNTLIIMALHLICFKLVGLLQIIFYKLPMYNLGNFGVTTYIKHWWILYTLAGTFIPILIQKFVIDKINKTYNGIARLNSAEQ